MDSNQLDQTDIGLLNLLQKDGHMTYKELAHTLRKSITPIVERIKRLKTLGYIKQTVAIVDISKINRLFVVFPYIKLNNHSKETFGAFQQQMIRHKEVMECYQVTGQYDFILKVAVSDMNAYNEFMLDNISSLDYVGNVQSFMVLTEIKRETAYML